MKKITFLLTIIVLSFVSAFGQNATENSLPCTNQTVEKISSRGIRLGMSIQETLNLFTENDKLIAANVSYPENGSAATITRVELDFQTTLERQQEYAKNNFGFSLIVLSTINKPNFDGILRYGLGFLDNRLAFFSVYYSKPNWESQEQFIRTLSEMLNLPVREKDLNTSPYSVKCGDYTVMFYTNYLDEVRYSMSVSANVDGIVTQRRKKAEDEQRKKDIKAFKP